MNRNPNPPCPCRTQEAPTLQGSPSFAECCQPFLAGTAIPETAEQLMRSRYTAFVLENEAYLLASWHPETRPPGIEFEKNLKWLGLKIKATRAGQAADNEGWVEFVARCKVGGKAERLEELSHFLKVQNGWRYVSAVYESV